MKRFQRSIAIHASALLFVVFACPLSRATDYRGDQFIGCDRFGSFSKTQDADGSEVLTSRPLPAAIRFDELVASWDADMPDGASLKVEARALHNDHATKYYTMGIWSADADRSPRESVSRQKDSDGNVSTDTLSLTEPADHFQIRLTLSPAGKDLPDLKYLGVCLTDTHAHLDPLPPNKAAWGKVLPVPEKSQIAYPNGHVICSATTTSMLISYWSRELKRPELARDVPEVVHGVYDSGLDGTGNWPFNTAYAGSLPGMRGCVSRFSDVSELEDWIAKGLPVGLSVDYDRLRAKGPGPNGHLVVCVGFTKDGDPIINDPGTSKNVRKIFPRKNLIYAWSASHNAVYLIYPKGTRLPKDRFGHWPR